MIILASGSPRRTQLLTLLGIAHEVDAAHDVDETPFPDETPVALALRLARAKAERVARRHRDRPVLAADTVVVLGTEVLGKPAGPADAEAMLARLAGRDHEVVTAVALAVDGRLTDQVDRTRVWFRPLDAAMIRDYVATGEPLDKAGSYGLQGYGAVLVERIEGDCFGVIGLPLRLVVQLLDDAGHPYRFGA
ncbi:MAG: Maf family protein [Gemmatimonadota bacterium]|nr:Maf family protein [Gemmatimonadota bacterium]MDH5195948.1 Maf family protein [Gemmatimonadota bacterium]